MAHKRNKIIAAIPTAGRFLRRFFENESGVISLQFLWQFPFMLWFGFIAVDVMMHEYERTRLQNTLDRAILAAADLDQEGDPEEVVKSYFTAAGIEETLKSVEVTQGLNLRRVQATAAIEVPTIFLNAEDAGYRNNDETPYSYDPKNGSTNNFRAKGSLLSASATGTAEESVSNVEVSLVLDVSGSMGSNNRLSRMKSASADFLDAVMKESEEGITSVSVIPYSATVNLGSMLSDKYTLSGEHDYSYCITFGTNAYYDTAISQGDTLQQISHFDPWSSDQNATQISQPWCPTGDTAAIEPFGTSADSLKSAINNLSAFGNTAIDLGMKWGVAMLDPNTRPVTAQLIAQNGVDSRLHARPAAFDDDETLKVVVLMTDGENTSQYDLRRKYKSGYSNIWIDDRNNTNAWDDRFSFNLSAYNHGTVYFWERFEGRDYERYRYQNYPDGGDSAERMTHQEAFARWGTVALAYKFYEQPYYDNRAPYEAFYDQYYAYEEIANGALANSRLDLICDAAKAENIVIFTVAFEAPDAGKTALRSCASTESHYFDVNGVEIEEVFSAIGRQINQLRLTK